MNHRTYIILNGAVCTVLAGVFAATVIGGEPFYTFLALTLIAFAVCAGLFLRRLWTIAVALLLIATVTPVALILLGGRFVWPVIMGLLVWVGYVAIVVLELATVFHAAGMKRRT